MIKPKLYEKLMVRNIFSMDMLAQRTGINEVTLGKIFRTKELKVNFATVKSICKVLGYTNPFEFERDLEKFDIKQYRAGRKQFKWKSMYVKGRS
jgi:DNA-binding Xre family transcriptional regulator